MKILKKFFAIAAFFIIFTGLSVVSCVSKDVRAIKTGDVIYFDTKGLNENWDNVKIYFYSTWGGSEIVSWNDSLAMEKIDGTTVFKYTVPANLNAESHNVNMLIFQNGKGGDANQTIDLGFIDTGYAYVIDSTDNNKQKGYWYVYDKSELINLYNSVKDYEEIYYTSDTWTEFESKLSAALDAINNEMKIDMNSDGVLESKYEDVINELAEARDNLVIDKSILKNKIDEVKQVEKDGYTTSTVDALNKTIKDAEDKYNSSDITVDDIKEQINNLDNAVSALEVDKAPLKKKIDEAKAIDLDKYTEDTVDVLNETIKKAEEIYNSSNITVSDVKTWVKNIDDAINGLIEKTNIVPDTNESVNEIVSETKNPNTGTYIVIVIIVVVIALIVLIVTSLYNKKKKKIKNN